MASGTGDEPGLAAARPRRELAALLVLGLLVGAFYFWSANHLGGRWSVGARQALGYYPMQVEGFRQGHLYASVKPHPALLALKDPYDPVANAPYRIHDMTLYKGHYYLYFGVTPALILYWPVAALTGYYLDEPFVVPLFCTGAIWTGMVLLLAARRRYFPSAPFAALLASWLCLALATPLLVLTEAPQFYQVPISCAIMLQALMLGAVWMALHSARRPGLWMGCAGLLYGLCVGARPNYFLSGLALLVPVVYLAVRIPPGRRLLGFLRLCAWTALPAAACGAGLLWYNWARFGSPGEFGMHYQLAGERFTSLKSISVSFLPGHADFYLFNPGRWQAYYPFFSAPTGQPPGFARYTPWAWLAPLGLAAMAFRRFRVGGAAAVIMWTAAAASVANLAVLSCFFGTTGRYPGDYANAALVLAGLGALAIGAGLSGRRPRASYALALWAAAAVSILFSQADYQHSFPKNPAFAALARAGNWPAYAWARARGRQFGGLALDVRLPEHPPKEAEPLLETGLQGDQRDWLQIEYLPGGKARVGFFHAGTGLFPGAPFEVPKDRRVRLQIQCGSLLPPFAHPVFSGWSRQQFDDAKRRLEVTANGVVVLSVSVECYEASPENMTVGALRWFSGGMRQRFSGEILSQSRLPLEPPAAQPPPFSRALPIELTLLMPAARSGGADPLLVTGEGNRSDLLYCVYDGTDSVRFALDHFGSGGPQSKSAHYDPSAKHTLLVWMGSMADSDAGKLPGSGPAGRLVVVFDGKTLLNTEQVFFPGAPSSAVVGWNPFESSVAGRGFSGRVVGWRQVPSSDLPDLVREGQYGAVSMGVTFPFRLGGTQEPLVVTGVTGAGDFAYVRYVDDGHAVFGFDHWGIGGLVGKPVALRFDQTHRLIVSFASLFPPGTPENKSDSISILLDGKPVLSGHFACHPSKADQVRIGRNPIGGSTCGPVFNGRILSIKRILQQADR